MSLDRRAIEKRDFPARMRGYDRAAVDAHLRWVADELEARIGSSADATAEQVRAVLEAAERSAAELVARAEAEAQRIGSAAARAGDASTARVTEAASGALERIEALRGELTTLLAALAPEQAGRPAVAADAVGARLVALDLALSGTPREQADRVLAEQFALGDERAGLLDDVYAAAGR
ncbi:MAG: DivIVA domain-containing protein [Actinobacteria bacterium]|nr:DivIVA domain-containing protein [Actinomycetota bacterium]